MKVPLMQSIKAHFTSPAWGWFESVFFTLVVLLLSFYFRPRDPFFFDAAFPWVWLVSVLIALRYGMGPGLLSVALVALAFIYLLSQQSLDFLYPRLYLLGGIILTAICGEYSSTWHLRLRRSKQLSAHMEESFNSLTRAYYLIRLSHDRLEQNLISKPITLRSAVKELRKLLVDHKGKITPDSAERFLNLVAHCCSLERAGLYLFEKNKINRKAIAIAGEQQDLDLDDPLIKECLAEKHLNYYAISELEKPKLTPYLVAAPLVTSEGKLLGLLAVEDMPFLALQKDTLLVMTVMMDYFANEIWASKASHDIVKAYPDCPSLVATELYKLARLKWSLDVDSSMVCFRIPPSHHQNDIILELEKQQRGLDYLWQSTDNGDVVILNLMAFANKHGVTSYLARIEQILKETYGLHDAGEYYNIHFSKIPNEMSAEFIADVLKNTESLTTIGATT